MEYEKVLVCRHSGCDEDHFYKKKTTPLSVVDINLKLLLNKTRRKRLSGFLRSSRQGGLQCGGAPAYVPIRRF